MFRLKALSLVALMLLAGAARAADDAVLATAEAEFRTVAREQRFDGVVEAVNRTTVSAQTSGRVESILFDVDDYVEKGAVVVRFRDTEQRAGLAQARAALEEAEARAKEAASEHQRTREVFARDLVAKSAMESAEAGLKAARARLEAARAGVHQAEEQLEYTVVRAPYSGIVTERHVELGELASPGARLLSGVSLERLRLTTRVPQRLIEAVRAHAKARVVTDGGSIAVDKLTIFPHSDPRSHTFTVRLQLAEGTPDKGGAGLYPGMFAKAAFVTGEAKRLVVPASAVIQRGEVTALYVVADDGSVRLRQIRAGRTDDNGGRVVLAGLEAGEKVALEPIRAGVALKGAK